MNVAATGGEAVFSGLTLSTVSTGNTLQATSTGLTSITTTSIAVTPGAVAQLAITGQPTTVTAGAASA